MLQLRGKQVSDNTGIGYLHIIIVIDLYLKRHQSHNDRTAGKLHFIRNTTPERRQAA